MPSSVFGLPFHPLIVHATVVIVPTAALAVLLAVLWPRFRRWAGWGPLAISVVGLVLVPLSTSSGENLQHELPNSTLIEEHSHLADGLLPWMIGLVVVAALLVFLYRGKGLGGRGLLIAATVLGVIAAAGTMVQVARIGHSGAKASWSKVAAQGSSGQGSSDEGSSAPGSSSLGSGALGR
ncbi:MAG: DUF2231 domain-containing protein [Nocardioidaceae bacterium]